MTQAVKLKPKPRRVDSSLEEQTLPQELTFLKKKEKSPVEKKKFNLSIENIDEDLHVMPSLMVNQLLLWNNPHRRKNKQNLRTVFPIFTQGEEKNQQKLQMLKQRQMQRAKISQPKTLMEYRNSMGPFGENPNFFFQQIQQIQFSTNAPLNSCLSDLAYLPATVPTNDLKKFFNVKIKKPQFNMLHQNIFLITKKLKLKPLNLTFQSPNFTFLNWHNLNNGNKRVKVKSFFRLVFWYLIKIDKNFLSCLQTFKKILLEKVEHFNLVDLSKTVQNTTTTLNESHYKILFVVFFFHCCVQNFLTKKLYDNTAKLDIPFAFVFRKSGFFVNFTEKDIADIFREVLFKEKNFLLRTQLKKQLRGKLSSTRKLKVQKQLSEVESKITAKETSERIPSNMRSRFSNYSLMFFWYQHHYSLKGNFSDEVLFSLRISFLYLSIQRTYYYPMLALFVRLSKSLNVTNKEFKNKANQGGVYDQNLNQIPVLDSNGGFKFLKNFNELNNYLTNPSSGFQLWKQRERDFLKKLDEDSSATKLGIPEINLPDLNKFNRSLQKSSGSSNEKFHIFRLAFQNFDEWLQPKNTRDVQILLNVFSTRFTAQSEFVHTELTKQAWNSFAKTFESTLTQMVLGDKLTMIELLSEFSFDLAISSAGMDQSFCFFSLLCNETFEGNKVDFITKYSYNITKSKKLTPCFFLEAYLFGETFFWLMMLLMYFRIHNNVNQPENTLQGFKILYDKTKYL